MTGFQVLLLFGILGTLTGLVVFLFRQLIQSKEQRITELVGERDYYRSAAILERSMPLELHPSALPPGTQALATVTPLAITPADSSADADKRKAETRLAAYSLGIQAAISIVVLILSFWLVVSPTDPVANTVAFNLITFIVGVWLGRGVDYATARPGK